MKIKKIAASALLITVVCFSVESAEGDSAGKVIRQKSVAPVTSDSVSSTEKIQTVCPVMGGAIERSVFAVWNGDKAHGPKKVYFCCAGCIEPFNQNPLKYIKKLEKMNQPIEDVAVEKK